MQERGLLPHVGYRVRTLHGLAYDIVRERPDLVGLAMLRELSPLLTAIIVAGRSGSADAAQIGTRVEQVRSARVTQRVRVEIGATHGVDCILIDGNGTGIDLTGATLTATSVGITARVLSDLGRLHEPESQIVLGAAVLDDIIGASPALRAVLRQVEKVADRERSAAR